MVQYQNSTEHFLTFIELNCSMIAGSIYISILLLFVGLYLIIFSRNTYDKLEIISGFIALLILEFVFATVRSYFDTWSFLGINVIKLISTLVFVWIYFKFFTKKYNLENFISFPVKRENTVFWFFIALSVVPYSLLSIFGDEIVFEIKRFLAISLIVPVDEELIYRGMLLPMAIKLLSNDSKSSSINLYNSILFVSIIFALGHSLWITEAFRIKFDVLSFIWTLIPAVIWSVVSVKTRSIIFPVISHAMSNALILLIRGIMNA